MRFRLVLLCYLSLTIPIYIFRGRRAFEPGLILNLFYGDIIIFYCYKLTVGFNLPHVSAAFRDHLVSYAAFQFYGWDQEWFLKGTWETMCLQNEKWKSWRELCYMANNIGVQEKRIRTNHEGPCSVWNLSVLTFTQVQSCMQVSIVTCQWSETELREFQYYLTESCSNVRRGPCGQCKCQIHRKFCHSDINYHRKSLLLSSLHPMLIESLLSALSCVRG